MTSFSLFFTDVVVCHVACDIISTCEKRSVFSALFILSCESRSFEFLSTIVVTLFAQFS